MGICTTTARFFRSLVLRSRGARRGSGLAGGTGHGRAVAAACGAEQPSGAACEVGRDPEAIGGEGGAGRGVDVSAGWQLKGHRFFSGGYKKLLKEGYPKC